MEVIQPFQFEGVDEELTRFALGSAKVYAAARRAKRKMRLWRAESAAELADLLGIRVFYLAIEAQGLTTTGRTIIVRRDLQGGDREFVEYHELGHTLVDHKERVNGLDRYVVNEHLAEAFACHMTAEYPEVLATQLPNMLTGSEAQAA